MNIVGYCYLAPSFLLQRISESENGLAPNMIALVE